jgi:probable dihydroxyacetone kinase regulator
MTQTFKTDVTKKLLAGSLKKFMAVKPLTKISVREIVEDCGVNRQTFYYHFQDIYDLVEWMFQQEAVMLLRKHDSLLTWEDGVLQLLQHIRKNRAMYLCVLNSLGYEHLTRFFSKDVHSLLMRIINQVADGLDVGDEYKEFVAHFYTVALTALIESWLVSLKDKDDSPEKLVRLIRITLQGNFESALERYVQEKKLAETKAVVRR